MLAVVIVVTIETIKDQKRVKNQNLPSNSSLFHFVKNQKVINKFYALDVYLEAIKGVKETMIDMKREKKEISYLK